MASNEPSGRPRRVDAFTGLPFVGRQHELEILSASLRSAAAGRGGLILISGEPGIGKSRLAGELADRAAAKGARVLVGRCWEAGGAPAYWPWVQSLRACIRGRDPEGLREEMGAAAPDLRQLLPELDELFPDLPELPTADPQTARFRLFEAVAAFLERASASRPLLVVLEDLHAADRPSLVLLEFLAGALETSRLLVVGTYRDVAPTLADPLMSTLLQLARLPSSRHLPLRGLSEEEVAALVGTAGEADLPPGLASAVARKTEGNPLFVGEIVRLMTAEAGAGGLDESRPVAIPDEVREAIMQRLSHLRPGAGEVLGLASTLGREFRLRVLEGMTGRPADDLLPAVEEAVGERIVTAAEADRFRFAHELIRDVLYEAIPAGIRMRRHRDAADALERGAAGDPEAHLAEVAHHLFQAIPIGTAPRAAAAARRAGDRALELLAHEEAVRLYEVALEALAETEPDPHTRCDLLLSLGEARARAGDGPGSKATFLEAATLAHEMGSAERHARAALGYGGRFVWARPGGDLRLVPLLESALTSIGEQDSVLRARLLSRLSGALRDDPNREPRWSLSREAAEMARGLGDPGSLAYALEARFAAIWEPETAEERREIAEEMMRLAEASGDPERMIQALGYRCHSLLELGDVEEARTALTLERRLAEDLGQPAWRWLAGVAETCLALLEGRFDEAAEAMEGARDAGRSAQAADAEVSYRLQRFLLDRERGALPDLEEAIRDSVGSFPWYPMFRCLLADLHVELGRTEEARAAFERVAKDDFRGLPQDTQWLFSMSLLAEVCSALGDRDRAAVLYERLLPFEDLNAYSAPEAATGSVARPLGILARTMGKDDRAEVHFDRALEIDTRMGARPWVAHTKHEYGRMLLERGGSGDRERAARLLSEALDSARTLGMPVLERRVSEVLDPGAVPAARSEPASDMAFRREGEYWSIAFGGETFRLRDMKGVHYLAHLLSLPGREVHVLDLLGASSGGGSSPSSVRQELPASALGGGEEVLDPEARRAYRDRIESLQSEIDEAESWHDPERAARAKEELEFVSSELAAASGLGGRSRRAASPSERARQSVTKAVRLALEHIRRHSPSLAEHLSSTVRTGTFCAYLPDPRLPARWRT